MNNALTELIDLFKLTPQGPQTYRGRSQDLGFRQLFGGQVLGQALAAARRSVEAEAAVHSLHAYFLRPGTATQPVTYEVDLIRSGRSFWTRRVVAKQNGEAIFCMSASLQRHEAGLSHQASMPVVAGPEGLTSERELVRLHQDRLPAERRALLTADRGIEIRVVEPLDPRQPAPRSPHKYAWFRAVSALPDDPLLQQALLAYASDFGLALTALLPHGLDVMDPEVRVASLDHALWFHRPCRFDGWFLYAMESPSADGGRGFSRGEIYTQAGELVASVAQEGVMRRRRQP